MVKTFQNIVLELNNFWAKQGCHLLFPYGVEVGAATSNPATFIKAFLYRKWNVAYVEPCRRPVDGRYGDNPNRFQHYFQYQVILKPIPENNMDMYLRSLETLGLSSKKHDIRFVEDNWESPSLGASGLGWEVWYDGMEISQYTYFQQLGGIKLKSPVLEITYGLERIALQVQNINDSREIVWDNDLQYGSLYMENEKEFSDYNFNTADIDLLRKLFHIYEMEGSNCIVHNQPLVAYDYVLKMSHVFNVLDARGVIGPLERYNTFSKMRKIISDILTNLKE